MQMPKAAGSVPTAIVAATLLLAIPVRGGSGQQRKHITHGTHFQTGV
jgi:hypothetical protein